MSVTTTLAHWDVMSGRQSTSSSSDGSSDTGTSGTLSARRPEKGWRRRIRLSISWGTERSSMCSLSSEDDEAEDEDENMGEDGRADGPEVFFRGWAASLWWAGSGASAVEGLGVNEECWDWPCGGDGGSPSETSELETEGSCSWLRVWPDIWSFELWDEEDDEDRPLLGALLRHSTLWVWLSALSESELNSFPKTGKPELLMGGWRPR